MSYKGHIENGVVVFDGPRPPEGAHVRIEQVPAPTEPPPWTEVFEDLIGTAEGLPEDLAENHDHYIHGAPKK